MSLGDRRGERLRDTGVQPGSDADSPDSLARKAIPFPAPPSPPASVGATGGSA